MHTIDMITKCLCKPGDKMMILDKSAGGHASVKPVVERLGVEAIPAPYDFSKDDLDYDKLNAQVKEEGIGYILLAPSDLIKPLAVENIDTTNCVLLWDCSQLMGLIAAGMCNNPLKTMKNIVMFGGTHKTFSGPASGLIMTNEKYLHDKMETMINPTLLRHSQMHQKICLLFSLIEFEQFGAEYMSHMVHCSNYIGKKLRNYGFDIGEFDGHISQTHQQWTAIIEDRLASGLKIDEYCEKNQLSRNSYFYWLRKIREERATSVLPDNNDLLPASVSTGALVELVPSSKHNDAIPKIEVPDEEAKSFGFSVNGISITVGRDISEEMLSKIMRAARNA